MILHLFITLHLIGFSIGQLHITCFNSGGSSRYCLSYINKNATWNNANSFCIARNGTLAVLEESNINLKIKLSLNTTETCWVGGYKHDSRWLWLNGQTITQNQFLQGYGDCVMLNVKEQAILNYDCVQKRPFICQFNIDHYTFCVPGMSQPHEMCYTYVNPDHFSSWCSARASCFDRGSDLASLDNDVGTWGKFLTDAQVTRVFVGAAFNLSRWQWLDGNSIARFIKILLEGHQSVYHCAALALDGDFGLLPMKCDDMEKFPFLCEGGRTRREGITKTNTCGDLMQETTKNMTTPPTPSTTLYHLSSASSISPYTPVATSKQVTITTPILSSITSMSISSFHENTTKVEGQPISSNIQSNEEQKPNSSMTETANGSSIMTSLSSATPTHIQLARTTYKQAVTTRDTITPTITPSNEESNSSVIEKNTTASTISPTTEPTDIDNQTIVNRIIPLIISSPMDSKASNKQNTTAPKTDSVMASPSTSSATLPDKVSFATETADFVISSTTKSNTGISHVATLVSTEKTISTAILPTFETTIIKTTVKTKSRQDSTQMTEERTEKVSPIHSTTELSALDGYENTRKSSYMVLSTTESTKFDGNETVSMSSEATNILIPVFSAKAPNPWTTRQTITTANENNVTVTSLSFITSSVLQSANLIIQESTPTGMLTRYPYGISTIDATFVQGNNSAGITSISTPLPTTDSITLTKQPSKLPYQSSITNLSALSSPVNILIASAATLLRVTKSQVESTTENYPEKVETITTPIIVSSSAETTADSTELRNKERERLSSTIITITDSAKWRSQEANKQSISIIATTDPTKWSSLEPNGPSSTLITTTTTKSAHSSNQEKIKPSYFLPTFTESAASSNHETTRISIITSNTDSSNSKSQGTNGPSPTITSVDSIHSTSQETTELSLTITTTTNSTSSSSQKPRERLQPLSTITTSKDSKTSMSQNITGPTSIMTMTTEPSYKSSQRTTEISSTITTMADSAPLISQKQNRPSSNVTPTIVSSTFNSQETTYPSSVITTTREATTSNSQRTAKISSIVTTDTNSGTSGCQKPTQQIIRISSPATITTHSAPSGSPKSDGLLSTMTTTTESVTSSEQETTRPSSTITITTKSAPSISQEASEISSAIKTTTNLETSNYQELKGPSSVFETTTRSANSKSRKTTFPKAATSASYNSISQETIEPPVTITTTTEYANSSGQDQNGPSPAITITTDSTNASRQEATGPSFTRTTTTDTPNSNSVEITRPYSTVTLTLDSVNSSNQQTTGSSSTIPETTDTPISSSQEPNGQPSIIKTSSEFTSSSTEMELLFPTTELLTLKLSYIPSPRESTTVVYNKTDKSEKADSVASSRTPSMTESTILGNREAAAAATRTITSYSNESTDVDKISSVTPSTLQPAPVIATAMGTTETISLIEQVMEKSSTASSTNYVASETGETSSEKELFLVSIYYKSDTETKSTFMSLTTEIPNVSSQRAMTTAEHETGLPKVSKTISSTLPFTQSSAAKSTADTYANSESRNMSVSQPLITNKAIKTSQVTMFHALTTTNPSTTIMKTSTAIPSKSVIDVSSTFSRTSFDTRSSQSLFKSSETVNQTIKKSTESTLELTHTRSSSFVSATSTRQIFTGTSEVFDDKISTHVKVSIINQQNGQSPQQVVIISAAIGGAVVIVVAIVVIILLRRRRLSMVRRHLAARNSDDYTSFYEYSQSFPLRISRNDQSFQEYSLNFPLKISGKDQIASFNPLYEATNFHIPRLSFSRGYRTAEI